jgi:hypothetical protein
MRPENRHTPFCGGWQADVRRLRLSHPVFTQKCFCHIFPQTAIKNNVGIQQIAKLKMGTIQTVVDKIVNQAHICFLLALRDKIINSFNKVQPMYRIISGPSHRRKDGEETVYILPQTC